MATEKITVKGNVYAFANKKATEQAVDMLVGVVPAEKRDAARKKITAMLIDDFEVVQEIELPDKDDWEGIVAALANGMQTANAVCRDHVKTTAMDKIRTAEVKARTAAVAANKDKVMKILGSMT